MSGEAPLPWQDQPTRTAVGGVRPLSPGVRVCGRYRIADILGVGGMGVVYRAADEELGLPVALKVLRPDLALDAQWLGRFKQELVLARQVSHPNVVRIHDIGSDGDLVFLTMDLVPGRSLRDLLTEAKRLAPSRAVEIARQLALGLGAAHQAGVVHRDLKPGNVLVDDHAADSPRVAVTDFGIARSLTGSHLTRTGTVLGTLGYLSPEQARGEAVDGRSDLYALGLLLYEMLAGELPFSGATEAEILAQRLTGAPRLRWAGVEVPPRLRAIVRKLLATDPRRRYRNAAELIADLDRAAASPAVSSRRWMRVAAGFLAVAALAGGAWVARERGWLGARATAASARVAETARAAAGPRHAVALLPLADETGRPDLAWVATGLPEMLTAALAESPELRVLDSQRVFRTLDDLKLPRGPLPEGEAQRLAALLDADRLVGGRVRAAGDRLRIDLAFLATDPPGQPAEELHAEAPATEAFRLVEEIGATLRQRLAVSPPPASAEPASHSPAALAGYSRGSGLLLRGDALAAVPALERSVAADPRYTAAWVKLAQAREALGRGDPAREAARKAVETLPPGDSRAAYEARAVEARLSGRPEKAQEILAQLLARYPDDVEARVELAEAYGEGGSLDKATAALAEAVRLAPHHPRAWYLLGKYAIQSGDAKKAVDEYLVRALIIQNDLGSDQGRANVLNAFGVAYRNLGAMDRAVENYEQAAALRKKIGDERGYATTLRNLATIHTMRGEYGVAERQLQEGLALLRKLGDAAGIADLENNFGVLAEQRGSFEEALEHYRQALRAQRDLGNDLALAQSFSNVGYACYLLGRYDDALVYWRQGLALAKKSGNPSGVVLATQNLGQLELARGQWDEAVKSFLDALRKSRELGMKEATAASLAFLGRLAQYQGRPRAALANYDEALKLLRELGDQRGLAEFTLAQAEALLELGLTEAAGERLRAAEALLKEGTNQEQEAELLRLQGQELLARGDRAGATAALRRSVALATASHGVVQLLASRLSAAAISGGRGGQGDRGGAALPELSRLAQEADTLGNARLRLLADEAVAGAALAAGDPGKAEAAARAGLEQAAAAGGYAGAYRLHRLCARALARRGAAAEALAERRKTAEEIARVSQDLSPDERRAFVGMAEVEDGSDQGGARTRSASQHG